MPGLRTAETPRPRYTPEDVMRNGRTAMAPLPYPASDRSVGTSCEPVDSAATGWWAKRFPIGPALLDPHRISHGRPDLSKNFQRLILPGR